MEMTVIHNFRRHHSCDHLSALPATSSGELDMQQPDMVDSHGKGINQNKGVRFIETSPYHYPLGITFASF